MLDKLALKQILKTGIIVAALETTFSDKVASLGKVSGCSMQPVLNPDFPRGSSDWILQNKWAVANYDVNRGDIVTLTMPYDAKVTGIKRIVAVEGDHVRKRKSPESIKVIPAFHVWVEGDNDRMSRDSNNFGPVPLSLITSKVTRVVWPPNRMRKLDTEEVECDRVIKG